MGVSVQRVQRGVSPSAMNMYAASRPLSRRARHSERSEESRYSKHMRQSVVNTGLREGACVTLSSPPPTHHPERQHLPIVTQKLVNTSQRGAGSRKPTTPSLSHCPTSTRIHQSTTHLTERRNTMSNHWTKEQEEALSVRGKNLLLSAAAGSGKSGDRLRVLRPRPLLCTDLSSVAG